MDYLQTPENSQENAMITPQELIEINDQLDTIEEKFIHLVSHGVYQEDILMQTILHQAINLLLNSLKHSEPLNLGDHDFIKNVILLFQYSKDDLNDELHEHLPEFLRVIINYHISDHTQQHFWIEALGNAISLRDLMTVFGLAYNQDDTPEVLRLVVEPYLIALDAALQEFDFDTGKKLKTHIFTDFVKSKAVYLTLKRANFKCAQTIDALTASYPYEYRFLVESAIVIDYGRFINGLLNLTDMVFGGPSDYFLAKVIRTIKNNGAYTIPFSNHDVPIPSASFLVELPKFHFFYPFNVE